MSIGSFSKMMLQFFFYPTFLGQVCITEQIQQRYYVILYRYPHKILLATTANSVKESWPQKSLKKTHSVRPRSSLVHFWPLHIWVASSAPERIAERPP